MAQAPHLRSSQVDAERPWLGLRSFDESTRDYFFGRDTELRDLFERVQHRALTVIFGQSGLGKTSLLRAGLVPKLRDAAHIPIVRRLRYSSDDPLPSEQILRTLREALDLPDDSCSDIADANAQLWLLLHDPENGLFEADGRPRQVVIILDQFEEVFTLGARRPGAAEDLCAALATLVENRTPNSLDTIIAGDEALALRLRYDAQPIRVVLSLREDFLHFLERWKRTVPAVMENRFELRLLNGPQALRAVVEPGKLRCTSDLIPPLVSEATGATIVRFVAGVGPDVPLEEIDAVPPLLSLLCAELNEQREGLDNWRDALAPPLDTIRPEQLRGKSEDILQKFYDRCLDQFPPAVREFVEERLLSATGFRESTAYDTATDELERSGASMREAEAALNRLTDDRLLVAEERGGVRRIELTHDILTGVARRSRDLRREAATARHRTKARLVRIGFWMALLVAGTLIPAMIWALQEKTTAQEKEAVTASQLERREASEDAAIQALQAQKEQYEATIKDLENKRTTWTTVINSPDANLLTHLVVFSDVVAPHSFRYMYNLDLDPGYRVWKREGDQWTEAPPSRIIRYFRTADREIVEGHQGTVIQAEDSAAIQVFVSDLATSDPRIYFRRDSGKWNELGKIEDPK